MDQSQGERFKMNQTKYIVVENDFVKSPSIIIFPSNISHKNMSDALKRIRFNKVISAGFIDDFMQCYGESQTLNLKSRTEDTVLLHKMLEISDKILKFI